MWKSEFALKDLLTPAVEHDAATEVAQVRAGAIIARLARSPFSPPRRRDLIATFRGVRTVEAFDNALDVLYDVADAERVWIR